MVFATLDNNCSSGIEKLQGSLEKSNVSLKQPIQNLFLDLYWISLAQVLGLIN